MREAACEGCYNGGHQKPPLQLINCGRDVVIPRYCRLLFSQLCGIMKTVFI